METLSTRRREMKSRENDETLWGRCDRDIARTAMDINYFLSKEVKTWSDVLERTQFWNIWDSWVIGKGRLTEEGSAKYSWASETFHPSCSLKVHTFDKCCWLRFWNVAALDMTSFLINWKYSEENCVLLWRNCMFCLRTDRSITPGISILKPRKKEWRN